jgi:electron transfer flavoprotein alpha subunit
MDRDLRRNTSMIPIFAYIEHQAGVADDTAAELVSAARAIDSGTTPIAIVTGWGKDLESVCDALRTSYAEVWKIAHAELAYPNAELVRKALLNVLPRGGVVLVPHTHFGTDLGPGLSIKLNSTFVSDVLAIEGAEGAWLKIVRQEFGGQISAHTRCDISKGAVINIRPGAFKPLDAVPAGGQVIDKSSEAGEFTAGRRYLETIVAESADVDITKHQLLVSIGRGIQEKENIAIAEELAEALGGAVSCSRPVVDAKWLPKSRQVGSSGRTVKPRVYLACGISGSFQHMAGIKGNPVIVAINKNPRAPIFQAAEIGIVDDILEFLPELTERIRNPQTAQKSRKHFA